MIFCVMKIQNKSIKNVFFSAILKNEFLTCSEIITRGFANIFSPYNLILKSHF